MNDNFDMACVAGDTAAPMSFGEFAKLWFGIKRNQKLSESTLDNYMSSAKKYLLPILEKIFLKDIEWEHTNKVVQLCEENDLGAGRTNLTLRILKQMLRDAMKFGYLVKLPDITRVRERIKQPKYWRPEEVEQFLQANSDNPLYPIFTFALYTGLRRGELLGLCWDKVNLKDGWIEVSRIRDRYGLKNTTKTGVARYVHLSPVALNVLKSLSTNKSGDDFVFKINGKLASVGHISSYSFNKAIKAAGVPKIRFHDLRTTYASNYAMKGGDIYALSKILGHTSVEMTTKKYVGYHSEAMKKAAQLMPF